MKIQDIIVESSDADAKQVLDYIHGTHHEPLTKQLQQAVLSYPRWELRSVPLSSLHIPDQEYDDEEQEPEADPYNRVQVIDPNHAGEYSANFVDRRPIVVDSNGWIIDGNHRAWAAAELLNRDSIQAWVPTSQLNELGNAPAEYTANRKRKNSLFHATVDNQWVDVFFDRSEFNDTLHITFTVNGNYDTPSRPTSASKSTVKILSTVLNVIKQRLPEYIKKSRPPGISFTAKEDNRAGLYRKYFVPVIQDILGAKWAHEEYPSMGMTVFHWRPAKKSDVSEAFDQPYAIQWTKQNGDWHATADLDDGSELIVLFMAQGDNNWMVEFERDENMEITGEGDAPRVFATVLTSMQQFIAKRKPARLNFSADKEADPTGSRARLYDRMVQRYITGTGYDLTRKDVPGGATYTLTKQQQGVAENNALTEIAPISANQFAGGKDMLGMFQTPTKKHLKPLPGGTDLQYAIETNRYGTIVQIVDPGMPGITRPEVVAVLNLDSSNLPNTVQVGSITVDEDYRGRGLARALYGIVLTIMRKNLVSGSSQTPGGRRNWLSLTTIPGVEVQGLVRISNQIFDMARTATVSPQWRKYAERTVDQIMELGGQFYSKDNNGTYWLFDVVPGKGSLQPAVKNALSRLYGYDSDNLLLATWTGA